MYDEALPQFQEAALAFNDAYPPSDGEKPRTVAGARSVCLDAVVLMRSFLEFIGDLENVDKYNNRGHAIIESSIAIVTELRGPPSVIYPGGAAAWLARTLAPAAWDIERESAGHRACQRIEDMARTLAEDPDWIALPADEKTRALELETHAPTMATSILATIKLLETPPAEREYDIYHDSDRREVPLDYHPALRLHRDVELLYRTVRSTYDMHGERLGGADEFDYLCGRARAALAATWTAERYEMALAASQ